MDCRYDLIDLQAKKKNKFLAFCANSKWPTSTSGLKTNKLCLALTLDLKSFRTEIYHHKYTKIERIIIWKDSIDSVVTLEKVLADHCI